ncbi:MAG: GTP 3',8-cyclase MoaA [Armatimonadota bacterium]|nr:MAG: GTP 3',8-cyclase MoaA [Armatimonadota bacterium]
MTSTDSSKPPILDSFNRAFRYLRVSVTDRCNLRCRYCMPPEGIRLLRHEDILTYEEIAAVVRAAVGLGVTSVRITGGEPLVRRDLAGLVALLRDIEGPADISLTTNGALLAGAAAPLARAGINRVNVSIDSLDPTEYAAITRGGDLGAALAGLNAALEAGLSPVKVNAVMLGRSGGEELRDWMASFLDLARRLPLHVRFIELMPMIEGAPSACGGPAAADVITALGATPAGNVVAGAGPARYWQLDGAPGSVGLIAPLSEPFCDRCNRLRLTARGEIRKCLFSAPDIDLMPVLRPRIEPHAIGQALCRAWVTKPQGGERLPSGDVVRASMCQIGG